MEKVLEVEKVVSTDNAFTVASLETHRESVEAFDDIVIPAASAGTDQPTALVVNRVVQVYKCPPPHMVMILLF